MVMTFTHDDAFRSRATVEAMPAGRLKNAALSQLKSTESFFKSYGIDPELVVHVPMEQRKKKKSKWCSESRLHYIKAFQYFIDKGRIPLGGWILHDAGNEFRVAAGGDSIFKQLGFTKEGVFPPDSHHALSPNDNMWHGTAKQMTRAMLNPKDDVHWTVCMMRQLLDVTADMHRRWFENNCLWNLMRSADKDDADKIHAAVKLVLAKTSER